MTDLPPIAIPSYQRAHLLLTHTLAYLVEQAYPADKIFIFVANEEECAEYRRVLPEGSYNSLVVGRVGLLSQRLLIHQFFPEGQTIVQMDDDVKGLKMLRSDRTLPDLIRWGCWLIQSKNAGLFGVMPNDDGRKMDDEMTTHLTHILGSFFICKNDKDCLPAVEEKEDYERSILYFRKYKSVLRYKGAGVITRYQANPGGLQQAGRVERMGRAVRYLIDNYPEYCKERDKNGTPDLSLNWRAK